MPFNISLEKERKRDLSAPDFSNIFSTTPTLAAGVNLFNIVAGNIESSAAEPAPHSKDTPGAN